MSLHTESGSCEGCVNLLKALNFQFVRRRALLDALEGCQSLVSSLGADARISDPGSLVVENTRRLNCANRMIFDLIKSYNHPNERDIVDIKTCN